MKKILSFALIIIISIFLFISVARAVDVDVSFIENTPEKTTNIAEFISTLYKFALGVSGIVAVGMIVAGGIFYSVSGESPQAQSEGKDMIISALWGLALLFGSYLILNTVNPRLVALRSPGGALQKLQTIASCTAEKYKNGNKNEPITSGGVLIETFDENGNKENPPKGCLSGQETPPLKEITIGDEKRFVCDCYVPPIELCPQTVTSKAVCPRKLVLMETLSSGVFELVTAIKPGESPNDKKTYNEVSAVTAEIGSYYAENEEISKNSYIWLHPYYNKYGDVSSAKCLIYARKEPSSFFGLGSSCDNDNDYTTCNYGDVARISLNKDVTPCRL